VVFKRVGARYWVVAFQAAVLHSLMRPRHRVDLTTWQSRESARVLRWCRFVGDCETGEGAENSSDAMCLG
jgi:hypothetical protein